MAIGKVHSWKKVIAQIVLLGIPTATLLFYIIWKANSFYNILQNDWVIQGSYFALGIVAAIIFYSYRFRFLTTSLLLLVIYFMAYKIIGNYAVGEFDAFFISVKFLLFAILFSAGWLTGCGFSRSRFYTIFWSALLLCTQIIIVSKTTDFKAQTIIGDFAPILAYSFYIIFTAELIRNMNEEEKNFGWFLFKRFIGFAVVIIAILLGIFTTFNADFKAIEQEWSNAKANYDDKQGGNESMTKKNKDGSISNKDQTRLTSSLSKGKRLVFVAKLDNFFKDNRTPNPLYFTAYYYTKFDTLTQAFEIDSTMPDNDLFRPDPSKIPIYFAKSDSTVIKNTHATLNRKVVTTEVYKVLLAPDEYIAPSTAFFCQPIPVADEYKEQYKSAYRAKMWVSDLNSAYFIYNPAGNPVLEQFQEQRFEALRSVKDFSGADKKLMNYYTFMPANKDYDSLRALALRITANAKTPIDKMIAIRDYFLSKDEFGQPLFKYSDNPGIPGIPSASKLNYFLFENRKGYCAYFAGATLFMLRAIGIPSRVAAGFLTIDRSSKNPGWYWFYEDQAHAWTQVFFPGFGWIDFDTTVPDVNTQQAPQPDETPPLNMQDAYFVADGLVTSVDTVAKRIKLDVKRVLFHDKDYETDAAKNIELDVSIASISRDTGTVALRVVKEGMHITAASYAESLKDLKANDDDSMYAVLAIVPAPVPIDQIKIIDPESKQHQKEKENAQQEQPTDWIKVLWLSLAVIAGAVLLILLTPWFIWQYFNATARNAKDTKSKAFNSHRAVMYYMNQLGYNRANTGPYEYATSIDKKFDTRFASFSNVYQKLKYSSLPLTTKETENVQTFYSPFIQSIRNQVPFKIRLSKFMNIYNTIAYFTQSKNK
jgi:transglutaminase-like putative cysteine protease